MNQEIDNILTIEAELCGPGGPFELEEADVLGERMQVFKHRHPSLRSLLRSSEGFGDRDYIVYEGRRITYSEHVKAVASVARALRDRFGVRKGDRVAVLAANCPEWIISFWATISLGAVPVGMNGWWVSDEILFALEDTQPKVLIGDAKRLARLAGTTVPVPVVEIEKDFHALTRNASDATLDEEPLSEDDPACILYTSGTTGRPKGVVTTHRNILAVTGLQIFHGLRLLRSRGLPPPEAPATIVTSPLFHVSGLFAGAVIALATGIKSVWMGGRFDPVKAMRLIQHEGVTNWGPMTTLAYRFVNHPSLKDYDLSSVTSIGSGGSPMPKDLQKRLLEVFPRARDGAALGYGLTECSALATLNFGKELMERTHSSGRPLPTVQVEIRDAHGHPVSEGTEGEIHIRGPVVMLEYWNRPEETEQTLLKGRWLRTGDIGRLEAGHLIINSRARDLILRGSENVYPVEIENRLLDHPDVAEATVLGVDSPEFGQEVKAIVVPKAHRTLNKEDLAAWVGAALAYYKVPTHWEFRKEPLPRNAVGKVLKHLLEPHQKNPFSEE